MRKVCVATGKMTAAELDQFDAAKRDKNVIALENIVERIERRRAMADVLEARDAAPDDPETDALNDSLDALLASMISTAGDYDHLPLKDAHREFADLLGEAEKRQLAYGLAALVVRIRRNAQ